MMFEMMAGHPPFYYDEEEDLDDDSAEEKLDQRILNDEVDFPDDMSQAAISIVNKLLEKNPKERLGTDGSADTVRQHPFFEGIDWQALQEKRVKPPEEVAKKPEEDKRFSKVLRVSNTPGNINQSLFEGFSFVNTKMKGG